MHPPSIIEKTGQTTKGVLALTAFCVGGLLILLGPSLLGDRGAPISALVGAIVGTFGLLYAFIAICCPKCRTRWVWYAMRNERMWFTRIVRQQECPVCKLGAL